VNDDHGRWSDDLAAYVLDALEPSEAEELERHLETCDACKAELHWLRPAADLLPESVQRLDSPPELRERVMAEVRGDAERRAPARAGGRWRNAVLRPAVGLAGAVVIAAGVGGYLIAGDDGGESTVTTTQGAITASLVRNGDSGTLQLSGLGQLPAGRVYQAWVQQDGRLEPSSLFAARADGTASAAIPEHLDGAEQVMVTAEPKGGSRHPTSRPLVSVRIST
jgi:anti-sigma-K factor RskA